MLRNKNSRKRSFRLDVIYPVLTLHKQYSFPFLSMGSNFFPVSSKEDHFRIETFLSSVQSLAAIFNFSFYYWERWTIFCTFRDCHVDDNFISFFLHKNIFHTFVYIIFCFAVLNFQETSSTVVQTYVSLKSVTHVIYRFIKRFSAFV